MQTEQHSHLPRLDREHYQGSAIVHWTLTIENRAKGWLSDPFHFLFREYMLHVAAREMLFCPTYCLMPDHLHFVWMGTRRDSDQLNGMTFLRTYLEPLLKPHRFQHQPYDHVLREEERQRDAFAKVCAYILANPVREGLLDKPELWPFSGAVVLGYPKLDPFKDDYWSRFWRIYAKKLENW